MLRFQHIENFWLLLSLLLLAGLYWLSLKDRKKRLEILGDLLLVNKLMPSYQVNRNHFRFFILLLSLGIGIIGLANLQKGSRTEKIERKGIDLMIALDVSKSMWAKDMSPNRLEKSKQFINRLLEKVGNNRIGLIVFAGKAYVSVPLTVDISALKMNLISASPNMVPTQGTVIGEAINMARQSFNPKETKYKSIILISDGEDHDESATDEIKKAVDEGIMVNAVGIGSPEGAVIWDEDSKQNKRDEKGNEVVSKLNEAELQALANEGKGIYHRLTNAENTADLMANQINSAEQKNFGDMMFSDYNSYFQYFLAISLILLVLEFFIYERKKIRVA